MNILDLFCGLGGWSEPFVEQGDFVVGIDIDKFITYPGNQIVMDIKTVDGKMFGGFDLITASPPCTEFTRDYLPWYNTDKEPDLSLILHTKRIIEEASPKYYIVENVIGGVKYIDPIFGKHKRVGSRYLWGEYPIFDCKDLYGKWKLPPSKDRPALRSKIPYQLSFSLMHAIKMWGINN